RLETVRVVTTGNTLFGLHRHLQRSIEVSLFGVRLGAASPRRTLARSEKRPAAFRKHETPFWFRVDLTY
ncbi:MAG: hypothetical protein LBK55_08375, partial [Azoarcus sp.]|nr:hypothetical protein [Azoarcus sp.]